MLLCVFAVVSKEKFCLKSSSLALVEPRESRIVFLLSLWAPGCWELPPTWSEGESKQSSYMDLTGGVGGAESRGVLKGGDMVSSVVPGAGASGAKWLPRPVPAAEVCQHRVVAGQG